MKDGATFRIIDLKSNRKWDIEVIYSRHEYRPKFGESLRGQICDGAVKESESKISEFTHKNIRVIQNPSELI